MLLKGIGLESKMIYLQNTQVEGLLLCEGDSNEKAYCDFYVACCFHPKWV